MIGVRLTLCKMPILITPITSRQFIGFHSLSSSLFSSSPSSPPLLRWRFVWFSRLHCDPSYLFSQRTPTYRRERAVKPGLATDGGPWLYHKHPTRGNKHCLWNTYSLGTFDWQQIDSSVYQCLQVTDMYMVTCLRLFETFSNHHKVCCLVTEVVRVAGSLIVMICCLDYMSLWVTQHRVIKSNNNQQSRLPPRPTRECSGRLSSDPQSWSKFYHSFNHKKGRGIKLGAEWSNIYSII